jgi:hypothetical protein
MIKNGTYLINASGQYVYYAEFILSPTAYAVQLNTYPVPTASSFTAVRDSAGNVLYYTGNSGTAYSGWTTPLANAESQTKGWGGFPTTTFNPIVSMAVGSNFYKVIGFPSSFTSVIGTGINLSYQSITAPNVQPNSVAYLSISNISNPYANPSSILYSISPDVAFGQLISQTPPQFCWTNLIPGVYNQLRVQFLGNDLQPLTIRDPVMTIMLVIRDKNDGSSGK